MDPVQVAVLTMMAVAVGILIPLAIQFWLTLRQVQQQLSEVKTLVVPVLDDIRGVTHQVRNNAQLTSAIALAVTAGVQAWIKTRKDASPESSNSEETP